MTNLTAVRYASDNRNFTVAQYMHRWQPGDLLIWDNASVQHKATFDYDLPLRRLMHRTTVRGPAIV